jgi:hypothetical protein
MLGSNLVSIQVATTAKRRLAAIDALIAHHYASGDKTDVDELLDERTQIVQWFDKLKTDRAAALQPSITGHEAAAVDCLTCDVIAGIPTAPLLRREALPPVEYGDEPI